MGESKRRREAEAQARTSVMAGLSGDAAVVATTAIALFERFIHPRRYTGGCYLTTMFLNRFLREEHGIETDAVVGYVNDGTDDIFISHAWLEFDGLKTDLTLNVVEHIHAIPSGAAIVLDRVLREGKVRHTNHLEISAVGLAQNAAMMAMPDLLPIVLHKEREHRDMLLRAATPEAMKAYMDAAPAGVRYEDMFQAIA